MNQKAETYQTRRPPTPEEKSLMDSVARYIEWRAQINNELVPVHKIVDTDPADNRVYVQTHADSMVFCLPTEAVVEA